MTNSSQLLRVAELSVSYRQQNAWQPVLHKVNFSIAHGEAFGLVGESGCGKSTVALNLLGYRHPASRVDSGHVWFKGKDLLELDRLGLNRLRGNQISFVPQNPTTALNPGTRVGKQVAEILRVHAKAVDPKDIRARVIDLFNLVGLPEPPAMLQRYPHQLSGGQQQRVCIAVALACEPELVVLDEPTTGLDVTTQEQIVELLNDLRARLGMSMLYVTHDLGVLAQIADRIGVMYAGHMVEIAPTGNLFEGPRHPYTRGLIDSVPRIEETMRRPMGSLRGLLRRDELPLGCPFQPRCDFAEPSCARREQTLSDVAPAHEIACQRWRELTFPAAMDGENERQAAAPSSAGSALLEIEDVGLSYQMRRGWLDRLLALPRLTTVEHLGLAIGRGETFALVGESGSGKSTIARAISGLLEPQAGRIAFKGKPLPGRVARRSSEQRRRIQYVFQNPDASLNPRARVSDILSRPLEMFSTLDRAGRRKRVIDALADTRLDVDYARRFPDQLSGGERQRVAIARALIADPELLICDEVLSALDVSVQASIIELLRRLRDRHQVAMLFISHDLAVVRQLADRVGVIYQGQLMEVGDARDVFSPPFHPYTHSLILAVPGLKRSTGRARAKRSARRPSEAGQACAFAGRCPWQPGNICESTEPPQRQTGTGKRIRCHLTLEELEARAAASPLSDPALS